MWLQWLPWRWIVRQTARARGFIDPIGVLSQLQRFSQPAEVAMPVELLRLGMVLQARGLMNAQAVQHNLDWIWPYWAQRQFNPRDAAFIPRAFSLTQINLTHRNWTGVGFPDYAEYALVDPRGLVTPFYDSWSLDAWILTPEKGDLVPALMDEVTQKLLMDGNLKVSTVAARDGMELTVTAETECAAVPDKVPELRVHFRGRSTHSGWLAVSLRPYNPEGVSFTHEIELLKDAHGWRIDKKNEVHFETAWDRHRFSQYGGGDVYAKLPDRDGLESVRCPVGLATAAALFELQAGREREVRIRVPLLPEEKKPAAAASARVRWDASLQGAAHPALPDERLVFLYEAALRSVILYSPREIYPGPFTYKHFWFRDGALIAYAMLCAGLGKRVEKALDIFFERQTLTGYFHSQDGEWDSNGQVLWILQQFCLMSGMRPKAEWKSGILKGAHWILRKRMAEDSGTLYAGLFPAGFSAEHLGPNDFYYWDDFWGVQGLLSAAWLAAQFGEEVQAEEFLRQARRFSDAIDRSLESTASRLGHLAMPASPYRRMDTGAIGSIVAGYPLRLWEPEDPRLLATVQYLTEECFIRGAFFHDIAHSGINPYLTLQIGQVLLRAGRSGYMEILDNLARLASPTGQWPEAIHPGTTGGCMGDGQHVWAAAEWIMMIRNLFVREEEDRLILGSGLAPAWLETRTELTWGPGPTVFGCVGLRVSASEREVRVAWEGHWHAQAPVIEVRLPGHAPVLAPPGACSMTLPLQACV